MMIQKCVLAVKAQGQSHISYRNGISSLRYTLGPSTVLILHLHKARGGTRDCKIKNSNVQRSKRLHLPMLSS